MFETRWCAQSTAVSVFACDAQWKRCRPTVMASALSEYGSSRPASGSRRSDPVAVDQHAHGGVHDRVEEVVAGGGARGAPGAAGRRRRRRRRTSRRSSGEGSRGHV